MALGKREPVNFCCHKNQKSRFAALSKAGGRWYIAAREP
jgi:hypothetical protein